MISPGSELKSACKLYRQTVLIEYIKTDKGKPAERQGRKAMGLNSVRSIPDEISVLRRSRIARPPKKYTSWVSLCCGLVIDRALLFGVWLAKLWRTSQ